MEPTMPRTPDQQQIPVLDDQGRVIGVITRPVATDVLGPGREKVYLRRPAQRTSQAA